MKLHWVIAVALTSVTLKLFTGQTQTSVPVPAYTLHIPGVRSTAMSRGEKYLAALVVKNGFAEVEVWDFRSGSLLQAHGLPAPQPLGYRNGTGYVLYTTDDQFLIAYTDGDLLYLLRASDLEPLRTIRIKSRSNVKEIEVSPNGSFVAVGMSNDVSIYELDSGEKIRNWANPQHSHFELPAVLKVDPQLSRSSGLAWNENGTTLAISVADNEPCFRGGGSIYILNLTTSNAPKSFRVTLLPSAIAFGRGNSLYVASNTCGGYFSHWSLDLPIFDSTSGRETGKIPAGRVGIRNIIAISGNRQFLLAYADREKTTLEGFEDTLKIEDAQWQVWDLETRKLVLTLPPQSPGGDCSYDTLSSSGRFVYGRREQEVCVFSVLPTTK